MDICSATIRCSSGSIETANNKFSVWQLFLNQYNNQGWYLNNIKFTIIYEEKY